MEKSKLTQLKLTAAKARLLAVEMVHDAASGHPGGSLSCIDVLTDLYFSQMHGDGAGILQDPVDDTEGIVGREVHGAAADQIDHGYLADFRLEQTPAAPR